MINTTIKTINATLTNVNNERTPSLNGVSHAYIH